MEDIENKKQFIFYETDEHQVSNQNYSFYHNSKNFFPPLPLFIVSNNKFINSRSFLRIRVYHSIRLNSFYIYSR